MNTMTSQTPPHHPLLKAEEYKSNLREQAHDYNPDAKSKQAGISDMVGMSGLGVAFAKIPPNGVSTAMHYHLNDHEWVYILSGTGHLLLLDVSEPVHTNRKGRPVRDQGWQTTNPEQKVEEREVGPGDFAGFMGGVKAAKYAHCLRAGPEGLEYLMGGTRATIDTCSYPLVGKTIVFDDSEGPTIMSVVPRSGSPTPSAYKK